MISHGATVRRASPADSFALNGLLAEYFSEGDVACAETEQSLMPTLQLPVLGFYLAEAQGRLAGCVLCRLLHGPERSVECKRLYVRPEFRGLGLATQLMDTIEAEARDAGFAWMYLDSKNNFDKALAMYRKRGYEECERFNDNPQATFFFRKRLIENTAATTA